MANVSSGNNNGQYSIIRDVFYVDGHLAIYKYGQWLDIQSLDLIPGTKGEKVTEVLKDL